MIQWVPLLVLLQKKIEHFSILKFDAVYLDDETIPSDLIKNWISYIGVSYSKLQELRLTYGIIDIPMDKSTVSKLLATALINLKQLRSYSVNFCTASKPILDIVEINNIKLNTLEFMVGEDGLSDIQEVFQFVQSAKCIEELNALEVHFNFLENSILASRALSNLCTSLKNLTHLAIDYNDFPQSSLIFFETLQNLTMLEKLEYRILGKNTKNCGTRPFAT
jgi:hypothetical protein